MNLPIKSDNDSVVTFGDIGEVKKSFKAKSAIAKVNGKTAVILNVSKRTGENVIDTVAKVKTLIDSLRANLPANMQIDYIGDSSERIKDSVSDLNNNLILSILLVFLIIFIFVGWRSGIYCCSCYTYLISTCYYHPIFLQYNT